MAAKFELSKSPQGQYYFNLKAGNGQIVLTSQKYGARTDAAKGIESVRKNAIEDAGYDRRTSKANEPYFVLIATNGQIIGTSEMYSSLSAMETGIASVKANAADASLDDVTA